MVFTELDASFKGSKILDLGCGRGEDLAFYLVKDVKTFKVDINELSVNHAEKLGSRVKRPISSTQEWRQFFV